MTSTTYYRETAIHMTREDYHIARQLQRLRNKVNDAYRVDGRDVIDEAGASTLSGLHEQFRALTTAVQRAATIVEDAADVPDQLEEFVFHRNLRGWNFGRTVPISLPGPHGRLP